MLNKQTKNIKYNTGKWKKTEHDCFVKALLKFGKNWQQINKLVKTRSLSQIRSHFQKYTTNIGQDELKAIQMNDFERNSHFCKKNIEIQLMKNLEKLQEESQTLRKETDIQQNKVFENDKTQKNQVDGASQLFLHQSENYKENGFHKNDDFWYFCIQMNNQFNNFEEIRNNFNKLSFLPMVWMNHSSAFKVYTGNLDNQ